MSKNRPNSGLESDRNDFLKKISGVNLAAALLLLKGEKDGLSASQVASRRREYGPNVIHEQLPPVWYVQLGKAFVSPFNAVLIAVAAASMTVDILLVEPGERDFKTVVILLTMIMLSSLLRFWQEYRSNRAAEKLKKMVRATATVLRRPGGEKEVHLESLVPGDIVLLSAGDMTPADCRILESKDLFVIQSALTGEAMPVEKTAESVNDTEKKAVIELDNICLMGANIQSGSARAIVVHTGDRTFLGSVSRAITSQEAETSFDKGVGEVSRLLMRFVLVMAPLVFLINGLTKGDWLEAFLFAITVAVGLTPEMLPMIVTTNLAKGAYNMSKEKVIVRKLNAIQNIGAMDVLCTDKTGTLTMDKIVLEKHLNVMGDDDDEVLKWAYLNSYHQTGLRNLLDMAILEHSEVHGLLEIEDKFRKVDEIPFDFQRRRMSVILEQHTGQHLLVCKGAIEEMLPLCTHAFDPGDDRQLHIERDSVVQMDETMRTRVTETCRRLNEDGMRVLLVAIREFDNRELTYSREDESELILTGYIAFLDPPKPTAGASLQAIQELGIQVKVITGDNEAVTRKICHDVGLEVHDSLTGADLEQMDDETLKSRLPQTSIFSKINPLQKARIVQLLRQTGHTVGFMGDGINDAPALKAADVGISVDTAVDIAKESADIILLAKDLTVLERGVVTGRKTFGNIIKYIKMAASSNFGNMFSVVGASALLPFLPMLPIQLITQNMLYDLSQTSIPWDDMDHEFIEKPQHWDASGIRRFMIHIGPVSSLFDYATFGVLFFVLGASVPEKQSLFQSGWFVESILSQTLIIHLIRTRRIPFIQSRAALPVTALTTIIMIFAVWIPYSPFAGALSLSPLPVEYFGWLAAILLSYFVLTQLVKWHFIRRYKSWL